MGKLIVVTGGAGFIGSHLCERLLAAGQTVISLDNYFAGSRDNHIDGVEYREGHTKDIEIHIPETPDLIFHLGEYSRVEQSLLEPELVHDLNVVGTEGVVEFWKKRKCKLVYAGSSTKFGDGGMARTATPYASTKADNTELVKKTGDALGLPYAITYFYNVYGPRERAGTYGTVIEIFRRMYLRGAPITVTSPGTQTRNFTHVADIVDGLMLVGERGAGDEYGLGNEKVFSMLDVARLFGGEILMLPERPGNRMSSSLDTRKARAIGWEAERRLEDYLEEFLATNERAAPLDDRVLVFSTTFHPVSGPAEDALVELMRALPQVSFDVVTTRFSPRAENASSPVPNATVHRVGFGTPFDKYLFPILGFWRGIALSRTHTYLFAWAIFASYAAFAALLLKRYARLPLLITLADQDLTRAGSLKRWLLRIALSGADQVYGMKSKDDRAAARLARKDTLRQSIGDGDAFANQIRFAYSNILAKAPARAKRRVLIFSLNYYPRFIGGAEVALKEITDRIPDIEFHMIALRFDSELPKTERIGNVLVHRIGFATRRPSIGDLGRYPLKLNKYWYQLAAAWKADALHAKYRYDGTWAMMAHSCGIPAGIFKNKHPEVKYLLTLQEGDPPEAIEALMRPVAKLFRQGFEKADALQAISHFLLAWGKRSGFRGEAVVVPNAVDTKRFAEAYTEHARSAMRESFGKKENDIFIVTTSRLVHKNGIDDVIRALPLLPAHVSFLIYGIGPDEAMLKKLAADQGVADRTRFMGEIGHDAMPLMLSACDIFARPSRSEGMGNSFVEAMAAGLPVIATQEGGIADFLFDAVRNPEMPATGWAVDANSPEQIAAAVERILAHPEESKKVVETARKLVGEKYDWDLIAADMQRLFSKLLNDN